MATTVQNDEVVGDLMSTLKTAQEKVRAEREAFEQQVEETRQKFDFREQMIAQAAEGLTMAFGEIDFGKLPQSESESVPKLSISEKHLERIQQYLANKGKVRQADIVSDLDLNSGTVSVGLRRLEMDGRIRKADKERGSQVWENEAVDAKRETRVRPGEGVSAGRVAA